MIGLLATRRPADAHAVQQAWRLLDAPGGVLAPCAHLGVEAGVSELHPRQATLLVQADWSLQLFDDGLAVSLHSDWGRALFACEPLREWADRAARGRLWPVREALRGFSALFRPAGLPLLIGALRFDAHRLCADASPQARPSAQADAGPALGLLMGGRDWLQRDEHGAWWSWALALHDDEQTHADAARDAPRTAGQASSADGPMRARSTPPLVLAGLPQVLRGAHADRVQRSLPRLASGELVSLTLSQSYWRRVEQSARSAYDRLRAVNPTPGCFYLHDGAGERVLGASPDLQLVVRGRQVTSFPVCGTVARSPGAVGQAESLRELLNEAVDAAALAVCTDALRSDLAPWCVPGTLRLTARRVPMFLSTVVHTVDALQGELRDATHAWDLIFATAAPAMVTGTPRAAALRAIDALEADPRGWYGGMVVQMQADGDATVVTLLRAAVVRDGVAEVRTGGDLLADSDPVREEEESWLKTRTLWRAFGLDEDESVATTPPPSTKPAGPAVCGVPGLCVELVDTTAAFSQGLADALRSTGVLVAFGAGADAAPLQVLTEWCERPASRLALPTLALGDAALQCLAASGAAVEACAHGRGRLLDWRATEAGRHALRSWGALPHECRVASHASRRLCGPVPAGWQVWATDTNGAPLMLARSHCPGAQDSAGPAVLMLFRPDSLLSDAYALALLSASVQWLASRVVRGVQP